MSGDQDALHLERMGIVAIVATVVGISTSCDELGHRDVPPFLHTPDALSTGPIEAQRVRLTADLAFELEDQGTTYRAFAWEESDGNWTLVFYRREGRGFVSFGSVLNPCGYDAPRLGGSPRAILMRDRNLGIDMVARPDGDVPLTPLDDNLVLVPREPE